MAESLVRELEQAAQIVLVSTDNEAFITLEVKLMKIEGHFIINL